MQSQWNLLKIYVWKAFGLLNKNLAILGTSKSCSCLLPTSKFYSSFHDSESHKSMFPSTSLNCMSLKVHFLHDFENVKKWIFAVIFWRRGPMALLMCGTKNCDPSWFSPEIFFYLRKNWQKYSNFRSVHFFFDHTVQTAS